jgi:hypothetical protein
MMTFSTLARIFWAVPATSTEGRRASPGLDMVTSPV